MSTKWWISAVSGNFQTGSNYSDNAAPANGDTIIFSGLGVGSVTSGLTNSLTTVTIIVEKSYPGSIGALATGATSGSYLVLDGGTLIVGQDSGGTSPGTGPALVLLNFGSTAGTVTVYDSGSTGAVSGSMPVVFLKGSDITLTQTGGNVGIAALPGETTTLTAGKLAKGDGPLVPARLFLGRGVTTTLLSAATGVITNRSSQTQTTVTLSGDADYTYDGTGAHTTLNCRNAAYCTYSGTGTITTLNVFGGATFDRTKDPRALTITNTNVYRDSVLLLDNGVSGSTTRTNAIALVGTGSGGFRSSTPEGERL